MASTAVWIRPWQHIYIDATTTGASSIVPTLRVVGVIRVLLITTTTAGRQWAAIEQEQLGVLLQHIFWNSAAGAR